MKSDHNIDKIYLTKQELELLLRKKTAREELSDLSAKMIPGKFIVALYQIELNKNSLGYCPTISIADGDKHRIWLVNPDYTAEYLGFFHKR